MFLAPSMVAQEELGLDFGCITRNSLLSIDAFDRDAIELYTSQKI